MSKITHNKIGWPMTYDRNYEATHPNARSTKLGINCMTCRQHYDIEVTPQDFYDWQQGGKMVQDAFPYLSAGERELLLSGICDDCFPKPL